jgi:hypothetical protein
MMILAEQTTVHSFHILSPINLGQLSHYRGKAMGWVTRVQFPAGQDFSLCHNIQTGYGAYLAFYDMALQGLFVG